MFIDFWLPSSGSGDRERSGDSLGFLAYEELSFELLLALFDFLTAPKKVSVKRLVTVNIFLLPLAAEIALPLLALNLEGLALWL